MAVLRGDIMEKKTKGYVRFIIAEIIIIVLFVITFPTISFIGDKTKQQSVTYYPVNCTISDIYLKSGKYSYTKIYVKFQNVRYRLEEPDEAYKYTKGQQIQAYYFKDKIYAHADDVYMGTPLGKFKTVLLVIRFILGVGIFTVALSAIVLSSRKRKALREKVTSGGIH